MIRRGERPAAVSPPRAARRAAAARQAAVPDGSGVTVGSGTGGSSGQRRRCRGEPIGFATLNGGTTGGQAGETVTVDSYAELKSYAEASQPYVILVQGHITNGSGGGQIRVKSNKSIVGIGKDALPRRRGHRRLESEQRHPAGEPARDPGGDDHARERERGRRHLDLGDQQEHLDRPLRGVLRGPERPDQQGQVRLVRSTSRARRASSPSRGRPARSPQGRPGGRQRTTISTTIAR